MGDPLQRDMLQQLSAVACGCCYCCAALGGGGGCSAIRLTKTVGGLPADTNTAYTTCIHTHTLTHMCMWVWWCSLLLYELLLLTPAGTVWHATSSCLTAVLVLPLLLLL
jgi:hypothetical protein